MELQSTYQNVVLIKNAVNDVNATIKRIKRIK